MRIFVLISVAALGLSACAEDSERYGFTYVERLTVETPTQS